MGWSNQILKHSLELISSFWLEISNEFYGCRTQTETNLNWNLKKISWLSRGSFFAWITVVWFAMLCSPSYPDELKLWLSQAYIIYRFIVCLVPPFFLSPVFVRADAHSNSDRAIPLNRYGRFMALRNLFHEFVVDFLSQCVCCLCGCCRVLWLLMSRSAACSSQSVSTELLRVFKRKPDSMIQCCESAHKNQIHKE